MTDKPHLSGLRIKVKVIRKSGHGSACRFGGRGVIKPEDASHGDEFALPFRVGPPPLPLMLEIDYLVTVKPDRRNRDLAP